MKFSYFRITNSKNTLNFLTAFILGYFVGSFPTAYLTVKKSSRVDIRTVGSGNVGARNAFEVSGKKWVGMVVMLIDIVKGVVAVAAGNYFLGSEAALVTMNSAVFGHCYPLWLRFKGGRGLATAAGAFIAVAWIAVPIWLIVYFLFEKIIKNVHIASVVALLAVPVFCFLIPDTTLKIFLTLSVGKTELCIAGSCVCLISLSRHIPPIMENLKNGSKNS